MGPKPIPPTDHLEPVTHVVNCRRAMVGRIVSGRAATRVRKIAMGWAV